MNILRQPTFLVSLFNALPGKDTMVNYQIVNCLQERETYWYKTLIQCWFLYGYSCNPTKKKIMQLLPVRFLDSVYNCTYYIFTGIIPIYRTFQKCTQVISCY